jgi:hypothetical protein
VCRVDCLSVNVLGLVYEHSGVFVDLISFLHYRIILDHDS